MPQETSQKYIIRKYADGDEIKIIKLMEAIYTEWHSNDYWKWKYKDNPAGFFKDLLWLALNDKSIVGQYAVIPVLLSISGNDVLCSQSVDTATHPQYRRIDIFESAAKLTYQSAIRHKIPLTYGLASVGPSYKGFLSKLNWNHVFFLAHFLKILDSRKILGKYGEINFLATIANFVLKCIQINRGKETKDSVLIEEVTQFPKEINMLSSLIAQEYKLAVKRDAEYLNYRIRNPDAKYAVYLAKENGSIVGYSVVMVTCKKYKLISLKVAIIADLIALNSNDNAVNKLLNHIELTYNAPDVDAIACSIPSSHRYANMLKRRGYLKLKSHMGFIVRKNYDERLIRNIDITDPKNWFITHLDSDHV